jgi:hypothetical protein
MAAVFCGLHLEGPPHPSPVRPAVEPPEAPNLPWPRSLSGGPCPPPAQSAAPQPSFWPEQPARTGAGGSAGRSDARQGRQSDSVCGSAPPALGVRSGRTRARLKKDGGRERGGGQMSPQAVVLLTSATGLRPR